MHAPVTSPRALTSTCAGPPRSPAPEKLPEGDEGEAVAEHLDVGETRGPAPPLSLATANVETSAPASASVVIVTINVRIARSIPRT